MFIYIIRIGLRFCFNSVVALERIRSASEHNPSLQLALHARTHTIECLLTELFFVFGQIAALKIKKSTDVHIHKCIQRNCLAIPVFMNIIQHDYLYTAIY